MDVLKQKKCIIEHEKVQKTIKNYNSLSKNFALYEMQQYKAWFDDVSQVYAILAQPIIRKCAQTNRMEVNFEPKIFDLIRESEAMLKLNLGTSLFKRSCYCYRYLHSFFIAYFSGAASQSSCNISPRFAAAIGGKNQLFDFFER